MAIAYPEGGGSYVKDGKTYYPGAALMLADRYVEGGTRLGPKPLAQVAGRRQPPGGWHASEKMDGLRVLWNGAALVTRSSPGKDPKGFSSAPAWFTAALPRGFALDGELWLGRGRFHDVAGVSTSKLPDEAKWARLRYAVFDAPAIQGGLEERIKAAAEALAGCRARWDRKGAFPASVVKTTLVRDEEHLAEVMASVVAAGGEGLILRSPGSPYVPRRSKHMLKLKVSEDTEVVVTGFEPGGGKYEGMLGALLGEELDARGRRTGRTVAVGTGFSDEERRDYRRLFPPGTVVSVAFMERTPGGALRMPSFRGVREDKSV